MNVQARVRPAGVTAIACLFAIGTLPSGLSAISLLTPGGALEPIWKLNPRARESFARMGAWAPILLVVVCVACVISAYGLFSGRRWGYRLGVGGLLLNLTGDVINGVLGSDSRTLVGVPIVALILWYLLSRRVREFFRLTDEETG